MMRRIISLFYPAPLLLSSILFILPFGLGNILSFERNSISLETQILGFGNIYFSDFNGFPNYACCSNFSSGFGLRYGLGFGGQWLSKKELFDTRIGAFFSLTFRDYSGTFEKEDYFADLIIDEKVYRAISRHTLKPTIRAIDFAFGTKLNSILGLDNLNLKLGVNLSIPTSSRFFQEERLISPDKAYFENGSKVRNNYQESIPNVIAPQVVLRFAPEWKAAKFGNFEILPTLVFDLPFINFTKDVNWKIYSLGGGITIRYNIPKPSPLPPLNPIIPNFPKPLQTPEPVRIAFDLEITSDGKEIEAGDTLLIQRLTTKKFIKSFVPPFLFFERNDFALNIDNPQPTITNPSLFSQNQKVLFSLLSYLQNNPKVNVEILCSRLDDELPNVCQNRSLQVVELLRSNGIADNRISIKEEIRKTSDFKSQELAEESRSLQFILSDGAQILHFLEGIDSTTQILAPKIEVKPKCDCNGYVPKISGVVTYNNKTISQFSSDVFLFDLTGIAPQLGKENILAFEATVHLEDVLNTNKHTTKDFLVVPEDSIIESVEDYRLSTDGKAYLFGLCLFDKKEFYWINPSIKQIVEKAIEDNKKIFIVGSVDNIGGEGYNYNLAMERARNAKKLLGNTFNISTKIFNQSNNGNSTPHERVLNRSAWIVVEQ